MMPMKPSEVLAPGKFQDKISTLVPEINRIANIDVHVLFNLDSSDIGIKQWDLMSAYIFENLNNYDGFVIIHGTDTMVYSAAALSFSLKNLNKPVIFTGAQRPLSRLRNDARLNLIDAVELATLDIPEVVIVFGQKVLRGNRAKKVSVFDYQAFRSSNFPLLGEIGVAIDLDESKILKSRGEPQLVQGFEPKVAVLTAHPSLNPEHFMGLINQDFRAFIIQGFGSGNLPGLECSWLPFISEAVGKGNAVFIGSHSMHGRVDLNLYASASNALKEGAKGIGVMTVEAAYVKLQKILAHTSKREQILDMFDENWAGEF